MSLAVAVATLMVLASCKPSTAPAQPLQPGVYGGHDANGDSITITLVATGQNILVQSVGHNFAGSGIAVDTVAAKDGKPFGEYHNNILKFPIVFLSGFSPVNSILTDSGGKTTAEAYDGTMSTDGKVITLKFDESGQGNTFSPSISDIQFSTAKPGFAMKDSYVFELSKTTKSMNTSQ